MIHCFQICCQHDFFSSLSKREEELVHCNDFPLLRLGWILILAQTQGGTTIAKEQQSPAGCQESLSSLNQAWPHGCKAQKEARQAFLPWTQEKRAAQEGCEYTGVSPPRCCGGQSIGQMRRGQGHRVCSGKEAWGMTLLSAPTK